MITPVILCGGSGTRLWPLSRKSYPKQFAPLLGQHSLFQDAARRMSGSQFAPPMIVTNSDFRFIVTQQLAEAGIDAGAILIEPEGRNTAPAVLAAALFAAQRDPNAVLLVAPSDHAMADHGAFQDAAARGMLAVHQGKMVTFGIPPTRPETGYGYVQTAKSANSFGGANEVLRFVEKPDLARAQQMLDEGQYLWNAGIFLFRAADMIAAFTAHAPQLLPPVQGALDRGAPDLGFFRLEPVAWAGAADISLDFAVMEHAANLAVVPYAAGWSDLGDWDAVWRASGADADGVATQGAAHAIDCENSLLRADSDGVELVGIGLKNIIAVAMSDAVLVADMSRAQDVRTAVSWLSGKGAAQAVQFPKDHRPWGWFETLALGGRFQVKRIHLNAGAALSLQSHHHRSEHWIVVQGTARVTVDGAVQLISENQSVYIPLGAKHRMENPGKLPMILIEVQTGAYLGEDDIIRYDDAYARGQGAKG